MSITHDPDRHHPKTLHRTIEHTITLTLSTTAPANDDAAVPPELWLDADPGPATECACAMCPYRARFLHAMVLLRELAQLVDVARSMPSPSSQRGA